MGIGAMWRLPGLGTIPRLQVKLVVMTDLALLPATQAARRLREGSLTATELTEALLARIAAREPALHAFAWQDAAGLRRAAAAADALPASARGPLHGLGFGVKDVLDTADLPAQYGSPIWAGHRPRSDAACVALARRAGALVVGKTVTTEFATRQPGPTANPANPGHTPGGSSSGSAAGVADGFFHVGFGTQTAGSIVRPAAYCGAVGFKPSYGTIARGGMKVMSESLDTIGVLTRTVGDAALFMAGCTGRDYGDPEVKPGRAPRLGVCLGPTGSQATPYTLALLERAAAACAKAGATIVSLELPAAVSALVQAHPVVMNAESAQSLAWEVGFAAAQISEGLLERLGWGAAQGPAALDAGRQAFAGAQAAFADVVAGVDAILTPSASGEAPEGLEWTGDPAFNFIWTSLWVPCVTVPVATGPKGLPLGVQLVTGMGQDRAALAWAEWVRQAVVG
jgi:Asp-tRNA(Asn)/Glu-tRNA(Gln) amidotransferase A subunit family amidase